MDWNLKKMWPAAAASLVAFTGLVDAACDDDYVQPQRGPSCPINPSVNPQVPGQTCDWFISVAGLAWVADEDGLEYAVDNENISPSNSLTANTSHFYNDEVLNPHFKWHGGFKLGLGHVFDHDGWDLFLNWTHFQSKSKSHDESDDGNTHTLFPLWSAFVLPVPAAASNVQNLTAVDIEADWQLRMNIVDLELGREFYTSKWLTLRPFIGIRGINIHQDYGIEYSGPDFAAPTSPVTQLVDEVDMKLRFKGVGPRAGLDSQWILCGGWSLYGNAAISLIQGKFEIDQEEDLGPEEIPFLVNGAVHRILDFSDEFRVSRAITDLAIGLQYEQLCGCTYFTIWFGWEHHMFFHQNQFVRFNTIANAVPPAGGDPTSKYTSYVPEKGNLTTQGLTVGLRLDF